MANMSDQERKSKIEKEAAQKTTEYKIGKLDGLSQASINVLKLGIEEAEKATSEGHPETALQILNFSQRASNAINPRQATSDEQSTP